MIFLDTETFSETPIKNGTYVYCANCEVDIVSYAVDDGPVHVLDMGGPARQAHLHTLKALLLDSDDIVVAHNAMFDRNALRLGNLKIDVPIRRWRCSMVRALAHGLPGGLDVLGEILGIEQDKRKHKEGKDLMGWFCKPRPKNSKIRRFTRDTHPDEWARYLAYAGNDIEAMRAINAKLPSWNYTIGELPEDPGEWKACHKEVALWHLDQKINDRGFMVDTDLARAALRAVDREQARLAVEVKEQTADYVSAATQRDRMLEHILMEYGIDLPDLKGSTIERRLNDPDMDEGLKELLRIRLQASTTSTAKYKALLKAVNDDDRLRGTLQFDGAARTRRDAGRTFQPQNLPSRGLLSHEETEFGIEAMKANAEDLLVPDVMKLAASAIRGCIIAPPGKKLVIADLSNIEGRGLAWLAGEEWKLQAFRDFDEGHGPDLYKLAYAKSFNIPHEEVTKPQRQIGKVQELGLGYAGGINAFVTFTNVYGIDLEEMAKSAWDVLPGDLIAEADDFVTWLASKGTGFPMSHRAAVVCEVFKRSWRAAHPATVAMWRALEDGFKDAVRYPGKTFTTGRFKIRRDGAWLRIQLPSGRFLCYPSPEVDDEGQCSYMGINQYTRKWQRIKTYSGKLAENCIAEGTPVLTERGWLPIEEVAAAHRVWDGHEWVTHKGCKYKGKQVVSTVFGVGMTADHLVLTEKGWRHASSCEGYYRATCRLPDSREIRGEQREEIVVGSALRLWEAEVDVPIRAAEDAQTRSDRILRLHEEGDYRAAELNARHVESPCFLGVAEHERPLPVTDTSRLAQLRWAGDNGVRTLANFFRKLLGGHGAFLPSRAKHRKDGQLEGLQPRELPVEGSKAPGEQHAEEPRNRNAFRGHDGYASGGEDGHRVHDALVPAGAWLAERATVRKVYDLHDCGPRSRFVVKGEDGQALIVHNCTQGFARDILFDNMEMEEATGYEIITRIHDELPAEAPDSPEFNAEHLSALLATNPPYAPDMPLAAAGFETFRYRKD